MSKYGRIRRMVLAWLASVGTAAATMAVLVFALGDTTMPIRAACGLMLGIGTLTAPAVYHSFFFVD